MACCCELQNTLDVEVTQDALLDVEIGGSAGVLLQAKSVEITENGTSVVAPDDGFDGLKSVEINTNVPKRFECGDAVFDTDAYNGNVLGVSRIAKINVSCLVTAQTTSTAKLFDGFYKLTDIIGLENLDTSNVTTMNSMFLHCHGLSSVICKFNTSRVTNMGRMFAICRSLINIDVESFDTSNVTNIGEMFNGCEKLKKINVSRWDVSKVTSMNYTFNNCKSIQSLDFVNWNTHSVTGMTSMLGSCISLYTLIGDKTLQDVENGIVALKGTKVSISTSSSPLRFSSILALANGLADLTGGTAQTLTISANSYKNMYNDDDTIPTAEVIAERQARIAAICAAKNWNFAH